ncbi:MAG: adenosylmethionine decarboxylase [Gammaproteobacteria bacterium]|nr:adenosylmethionine decarboxylase [Gammaproteobacteria bacterium]
MLFDPLNKMIINNNMPLTELKIDYQDDELSTSGDFLIKDGVEYSGTHLIIDLWGASRLDESELMEETLNNCVSACFATLLHIHIHKFSDTGGLSGVAVLAESHISVHTWPERDYAAFDVFMCGVTKPLNVIDILNNAFNPKDIKVKELLRGRKTVS